MKHFTYIFGFLIFTTSTLSSASDKNYKCEILQGLTQTAEGKLKNSAFTDTLVKLNKNFTVNRQSGKINVTNNGLVNENNFGKPKVLDKGSNEQAFKVLTIYQPNISVDYLEIQEFTDSYIKPFIFLSSGNIYSGICHHD
jgi:hypothetical protein